MRARRSLFGSWIRSFLIASAAAVTIFVTIGLVFEAFPNLGAVQLAKGDEKPKKCDDKDDKDGKEKKPKPCPTPSPTPTASPSPTCTPGGYGELPGCPTPPSLVAGQTTTQGTTTEGTTGQGSTAQGSTSQGTSPQGSTALKRNAPQGASTARKNGSRPKDQVLGTTITRPGKSSSGLATGQDQGATGTGVFDRVFQVRGAQTASLTATGVAVLTALLLLLIKRRKPTN